MSGINPEVIEKSNVAARETLVSAWERAALRWQDAASEVADAQRIENEAKAAYNVTRDELCAFLAASLAAAGGPELDKTTNRVAGHFIHNGRVYFFESLHLDNSVQPPRMAYRLERIERPMFDLDRGRIYGAKEGS